MKILKSVLVCVIVVLVLFPVMSYSEQFKIGIMQDKKGDAVRFAPLLEYLREKGLDTSFVAAKDYPAAARMFSAGEVDGMFSGSGIAACMIVKGIASPVVRPLSKEGWSTYWAVVLAPKGSPRFTQNADYFRNKRVIFCSLASSGEFFFRSVVGSMNGAAKLRKAASHSAAIHALSVGAADVAIVKNRVWDKVKNKYPNIMRVGEDPGENPNGTLIVSIKTDAEIVRKVSSVLRGIIDEDSAAASAVKDKLGIVGYIETTVEDFKFTIPLVKRAGVDEKFTFEF